MCRSYSHSNQRSGWTAVSVLTWKPTRTRSLSGVSQHSQHCPIKTASSSKMGCFMSDGGWSNIHQFVELRSIENTSLFSFRCGVSGKDRCSFHSSQLPLTVTGIPHNLYALLFKMNSTHLATTMQISLRSTNALTTMIHYRRPCIGYKSSLGYR